ncbi:MAG: 4Fe-4S binding protein [Anaerolineae bacterium]|nr:4Fe-4S binding protein [Anaerolineae bacterium]
MTDWTLPTIQLERCTRCGLCVQYCPTRAVEMVSQAPTIVRPLDCSYCGQCEDVCPVGAIELIYEIAPLNPKHR